MGGGGRGRGEGGGGGEGGGTFGGFTGLLFIMYMNNPLIYVQ